MKYTPQHLAVAKTDPLVESIQAPLTINSSRNYKYDVVARV